MKFYRLGEDSREILIEVMNRLYSEKRMNADDMRDNAQRLHHGVLEQMWLDEEDKPASVEFEED